MDHNAASCRSWDDTFGDSFREARFPDLSTGISSLQTISTPRHGLSEHSFQSTLFVTGLENGFFKVPSEIAPTSASSQLGFSVIGCLYCLFSGCSWNFSSFFGKVKFRWFLFVVPPKLADALDSQISRVAKTLDSLKGSNTGLSATGFSTGSLLADFLIAFSPAGGGLGVFLAPLESHQVSVEVP